MEPLSPVSEENDRTVKKLPTTLQRPNTKIEKETIDQNGGIWIPVGTPFIYGLFEERCDYIQESSLANFIRAQGNTYQEYLLRMHFSRRNMGFMYKSYQKTLEQYLLPPTFEFYCLCVGVSVVFLKHYPSLWFPLKVLYKHIWTKALIYAVVWIPGLQFLTKDMHRSNSFPVKSSFLSALIEGTSCLSFSKLSPINYWVKEIELRWVYPYMTFKPNDEIESDHS